MPALPCSTTGSLFTIPSWSSKAVPNLLRRGCGRRQHHRATAHRHDPTLVRVSAPLPICYLNGTYLPLSEARVSPLDRAFLFGDAVYEVLPIYASRPFRLREHLERLNRSLAGFARPAPLSHED